MRRILLALPAVAILACAGKTPAPQAGPPGPVPASAPPRPAAGLAVTEFDLNHDGKADTWKFTRTGPDGKDVLVRRERDLNGDGKVDVWETFDDAGEPSVQVFDLDFDGKPDVALYFEKGQLVRKEFSFGFDGKPRAWSFYEKGKLARKERDENGDGKVDYWEYWENGEIDRIGIDTDADGKVDRWEQRKGPVADSPAAK